MHAPFVLQLDTKNTLIHSFLALLLQLLLVYAKVIHPMQSWGREILLWLQIQ